MYDPEIGRRHDLPLYRESGLNGVLEETLVVDEKQYCRLGDAAYIFRPWIQDQFQSFQTTMEQERFNAAISAVRTAVEWSYKELKQMLASQDFQRALCLRQAIMLLYRSAALLWNFHCCLLYKGQATLKFTCTSPAL